MLASLTRILENAFLAALVWLAPPFSLQTAAVDASAPSVLRLRTVKVSDAIEMTKVGDLDQYWGSPFSDRLAHFSPDGKSVIVVSRRGNLKSNTKDYSLLLWRTDKLLDSPAPKVILTTSSSSNRQGIKDVKWLSNSETLEFVGEQPGELQQVYAYNVKQRKLTRLTHQTTNVLSFSSTPDGRELAFTAEQPTENIWTNSSQIRGLEISTQKLAGLIRGEREPSEAKLYFLSNNTIREIRPSAQVDLDHTAIFLSPNGRLILLASRVERVPDLWKEYSAVDIQNLIAQSPPGERRSGLYQCELIDTETGKHRILLDAPLGPGAMEAAWSADSRSVVINDTYLPLRDTTGQQRQERESSAFAVEIALDSGTIVNVTQGGLVLLTWETASGVLRFADWAVARQQVPDPESFFLKIGAAWKKVDPPKALKLRSRLIVKEDSNTPPRIFVVAQSREVLLFDPNPQFRRLRFGRVEQISWQASDGHSVTGGLCYPVDFVPGRKYPLVIQTHGWMPDAFWIDGPFTTAFAAQPLAGKNIMVLQVDENFSKSGASTEVIDEASSFEGAIDYLNHKQLIDLDRVGIIGFSRTCFFVKYVLTHSQYHFAAASITDGVDGGYFQYIASVNAFPALAHNFETINGGVPFGKGLHAWLLRSPEFSIDAVRTPIRITALNFRDILLEWDWFAALSRLGKPVEMIVIQNGDHILQRPSDRMISQQGSVDWFSFWLNGEQDSDPQKANQYARWKAMRAQSVTKH
jgi:dipeptidyl aminopeptidase/acylaminoacyl peptidase